MEKAFIEIVYALKNKTKINLWSIKVLYGYLFDSKIIHYPALQTKNQELDWHLMWGNLADIAKTVS